jgi:hypothetical protein
MRDGFGAAPVLRVRPPKGRHGRASGEAAGPFTPEIDVAVIADEFFRPGPQASDARAFIEVSDTTYAHDRNRKIPLYVRAGVPAWIVNIPRRRVEFYASPADLATECGHVFDERATFEVLGVSIRVAELLDTASPTP